MLRTSVGAGQGLRRWRAGRYQMSSQMVSPITVSPRVKTGAAVPDWK